MGRNFSSMLSHKPEYCNSWRLMIFPKASTAPFLAEFENVYRISQFCLDFCVFSVTPALPLYKCMCAFVSLALSVFLSLCSHPLVTLQSEHLSLIGIKIYQSLDRGTNDRENSKVPID